MIFFGMGQRATAVFFPQALASEQQPQFSLAWAEE